MLAATLLALLAGLLVLVLLVASIVALVRLLAPRLSVARGVAFRIAIVVLALFGVLAVSGTAAMMLMHFGMAGMGCC